jgi:tetratricopeptide (TPR) repeat protein
MIMDYLSLCLICKDENDYLSEWLDYHILMGVERFYIYDNGSKVSLRVSVGDYITRGWVRLIEYPGKGVQLQAYDHCLHNFGPDTRWLGFIDTDEFLVPKTTPDLRLFLKDFEEYGGLAVSSLFFGSNGQKMPPEGGQIVGYTSRTHETFFENTLIKSIVQPQKVIQPFSPHDFIYNELSWCVNENFQRVDFQRYPNSVAKIQLNHYFCRSEHEIQSKLSRGRGDGGEAWKCRRFDLVNAMSDCMDQSILENLDQLFRRAEGAFGQQPTSQGKDLLRLMHELAARKNPATANVPEILDFELRPGLKDWFEVATLTEEAEKRQDFAEVKRLSFEKLKIYPQKIPLYLDIATSCLKLNDPQTAWEALSEAWRWAPNSFYVLKGMVNFFLRVRDYPTAEKMGRMLLEIAPHDLTALGYMTEALIGQRRYVEAIQMGLPVVELNSMVGELPEGMCLFLIRGLAGYAQEQSAYQTLVALWEAGVRCEPDSADGWVALAKAHWLNRNFLAARAALRTAQRLAPKHPEIAKLARQIELEG